MSSNVRPVGPAVFITASIGIVVSELGNMDSRIGPPLEADERKMLLRERIDGTTGV